nr:HNH endonuclease signature motif containing protein [Raineyella fluvialis]
MTEAAIEAADRLRILAGVLVAETEAHGSDLAVTGLGVVSWLADTRRMTSREVWALVHEGRDLAALPALRAAGLAGTVSPQQARAISQVIVQLPDDLGPDQLRQAERDMIGYAGQFDSHGLSTLSQHLLEVLAPEIIEEQEAKRLERELRRARKNRELTLTDDGHGSVQIKGKLPVLAAQTLITQIDALVERDRRRALDALDPLAEELTPTMRRADALVALAEAAALHGDAPLHGGDRPRIVVTIPEERLRDRAATGGLIATGERIAPADLRRLCCDADVLPVVLGGEGQVLDVGREHRLVTPPIRTALTVRDGGCAFPGCDRPPAACHAHHIIPWQEGGSTSLDNLVLVCPTTTASWNRQPTPAQDAGRSALARTASPKSSHPPTSTGAADRGAINDSDSPTPPERERPGCRRPVRRPELCRAPVRRPELCRAPVQWPCQPPARTRRGRRRGHTHRGPPGRG